MKRCYYFLVAIVLSYTGLSAQCIQNGNFETGVNPWKFKHRALSYSQVGCNMNTSAASGFVPFTMSTTPNQFTAPFGTIVSNGLDPYLLACTPSVSVPRVIVNQYAMKLNINDGNADVTSMYQNFTGGNFISFSYAFSAQNAHQGDPNIQPFFTARIIDVATNGIIASYCLKADSANPIFGITTAAGGGETLYTGWRCETLNIPSQYSNNQLMLEFIVADCGAAHDFGTVYLDNINCTVRCGRQGAMKLQDTDDQLTAYPNPVNDVLTVSGAENTNVFTLTDMYGKELIRVENVQKAIDLNIDVSGLATGIYMLHADGINTIKVIKN